MGKTSKYEFFEYFYAALLSNNDAFMLDWPFFIAGVVSEVASGDAWGVMDSGTVQQLVQYGPAHMSTFSHAEEI